jgi:hypothetical protein
LTSIGLELYLKQFTDDISLLRKGLRNA